MNMDRETLMVLSALAIVLLIALAAWFVYRRRQSQHLKQRFGPEYGRAVDALAVEPRPNRS
jgi:LPXTG-motif cell wall-anchored protein